MAEYIVSSGESSNGINLNKDDFMTVLNGGIVTTTTVNSRGYLHVSSGGTATEIVENGGYVEVEDCANTTFTPNAFSSLFLFNADATVHSGTTANSTTVNFNGRLEVFSGGTATEIVENGGSVIVEDGANVTFAPNTFSGLVLYLNALATAHSGTTANSTTVISTGIRVFSGGVVNNTTVISRGKMYVSSGGIANITTVSSTGGLYVSFGGTANNATVSSGGSMWVSSGGTVNNATVNYGGNLRINSGDTMTGQLTITQGGTVFFVSESILDFDISKCTPNNQALVTNHFIISGTPIYTLTVSETQFGGIYTLADYATNFNSSIIVQNVLGEALGTLSLGKTLDIGDSSYTLSLDSSLTLTVEAPDRIAPIVSNIQASITTLTNQNVVLTADFADDVELAQSLYKLGEADEWTAYPGSVTVSENTTVFFKAIDTAGNESIVSYDVMNIDKVAPETPETAADITTPTNGDVLVMATFSKDSVRNEFSLDGENWGQYFGGVLFGSNRTAYFRGIDAAGNISEIASYTVTNIDRTAPAKPIVVADITTPTNKSVSVSATFDEDSFTKEYSLDGEEWHTYTKTLLLTKNETVSFRGTDEAGNTSEVALLAVNNIDTTAPTDPSGLQAVVSDQTVVLVWNASTDNFGIQEYVLTYSLDEQEFTVRTSNTNYVLNNADFGSYCWTVQAVDFAGNESAATAGEAFTVSGFKPYTVEYSPDNFEHVITFAVTTPSLDAFRMPTGTYQMRVKQEGSSEWITGDPIVAEDTGDAPQLIKSDSDCNADVFFANSIGTWESGYQAQHVGSINDWNGTSEYAALFGKNKIADIFEGSADANTLLMTDDNNGDGLFVDDIYSASPNELGLSQSRIARIDEIRAGAGDDIVDMTSNRIEYIGSGLTIRGGDGNDVIWANKGDNGLFGDAGNDRIVGASGNDVIAGGIGNDRMHGGGGDDIFTFCDNWGNDEIEQLAGGKVTLWFVSGSEDKWNASTLTYTDGDNSVKVTGITADKITLKFGDDGSDQFATLSGMGAFDAFTSQRIFEESGLWGIA